MYQLLLAVFGLILGLVVFGLIKYGFNIIFLYILLFSLIVIIWLVLAIKDRAGNKEGEK